MRASRKKQAREYQNKLKGYVIDAGEWLIENSDRVVMNIQANTNFTITLKFEQCSIPTIEIKSEYANINTIERMNEESIVKANTKRAKQ